MAENRANDDENSTIKKKPTKSMTKKRKKKTEVVGFASEYRAAKRFASDPTGALGLYDENIENAMVEEENLVEEKPEARFVFPPRSVIEKQKMLDDLFGTLSEEDLKYLAQVNQNEDYYRNNDVKLPFGSEQANKAHLNMRKHMIEGKAAEGHPKWWRGCSRCDVIEVSEKQKSDTEEMEYEDLTKAPIKSHVIQAANSTRRDQRGDQRRIAVLNANLDAELIKMYTTSTLQVSYMNFIVLHIRMSKYLIDNTNFTTSNHTDARQESQVLEE